MAHYFPYDVKLGLLADSRSFLANQKARNAIVGAENLLKAYISISALLSPLSLSPKSNLLRHVTPFEKRAEVQVSNWTYVYAPLFIELA